MNPEANIITYETLESTNKTAKEMLADNPPHGTVIIANHQTAGKGRYNRPFQQRRRDSYFP